jgi:hypothetical protein
MARSLTAVRPNGSRTWSRLHPFFPAHDLLHYAVETTLGFHEAFFGLLAAGWAIDDFSRPAEEHLGRIRARHADLLRRWSAVTPGEHLAPEFPAPGGPLNPVHDGQLDDS